MQKRRIVEAAKLVLRGVLATAISACAPSESGKSTAGSASAGNSSEPKKADASAAPAVKAGANVSASAKVEGGSLTKEEFCQAAVDLGEKHLAKAPSSERANVPSIGVVKDLASTKKECAARVDSTKVEFHGDVAFACIEGAKKRGGSTTFFTFHLVPECQGVVTGKATDGQPALFAEECAPGTAMVSSRCVKPVAKNGKCEDYPSGLLGKTADHPRCEQGTECFMTRFSADGFPAEFACLEPRPAGSPCKLDLNTCGQGTSCYQGKCRELAAAGGDCMNDGHCQRGLGCEIKGGAFGTCKATTE